MNIKLSLRLQKLYDLVPNDTFVADIGADHGYLIAKLILDKKIEKGYACENKQGPFIHLQSTINECQISDKVLTLLSDGLNDLPVQTETLVLAGMGYQNIRKILNRNANKLQNIKYLLCDSHTDNPSLRMDILSRGFKIKKEVILEEENVFYELILFEKGTQHLTSLEIEYGPFLIKEKSATFMKMLSNRLDKIAEIKKEKISNKRFKELEEEKERIMLMYGNKEIN